MPLSKPQTHSQPDHSQPDHSQPDHSQPDLEYLLNHEGILPLLLSTLQEAVLMFDQDGRVQYVNETFTRLTGYTPSDVIGHHLELLVSTLHPREPYQTLWKTLANSGVWQGEIWGRRKSGDIYPASLTLRAAFDRYNHLTYLGVFLDISQHRQLQEELHQTLHYDHLTGLVNRTAFQLYLRDRIVKSPNRDYITLICLDIDRFQNINDSLGQLGGDEVLRLVGLRVQQTAQDSLMIGRLCGDGFGIVAQITHPEEIVDLVQRVLQSVSQPIFVRDRQFTITASAGIARFDSTSSNIDDFLVNADTALYEAKGKGGNTFCFYEPGMQKMAMMNMELQSRLHQAIEGNEFLLYYQPQLNTKTQAIIGFEALLRWQHPELGLVPPCDFIPFAEKTGLILSIGVWVLRTACFQFARWIQQGLTDTRIAVNLSARQFRQTDLVEVVEAAVRESGIPVHCLDLEITETIAMENIDYTLQQIQRLRDLGVQVTIDDFGTGYSSLGYLRQLPISRLKIDRSFVEDIQNNQDDATITQAIVTLAHALRIEVLAEGVETIEQHKKLSQYGCDEIQGFLFGRPQSGEQVETWLSGSGMIQG